MTAETLAGAGFGRGRLDPVLGPATQLGFVVRDLDTAVHHWIDVLGVGPFLHLDKGTGRPPAPSLFRGEEVRVEIRLAFGFIGDVQIELIQQANDAPSPYREFIEQGHEGLQHLGYWVQDYAGARRRLEAAGYVPELEIPIAGSDERIVYYRSPALVGPMLEIVPARWRAAREAVTNRLRAWTGGDPLIRYDTYADFIAAANVTFT